MEGIEIEPPYQNDSKTELLAAQNISHKQNFNLLDKLKELIKEHKVVIIATLVVALGLLFIGLFYWKDKLEWKAWVTIVVVYFTFLALIKNAWTTELIMMANTSTLLLLNIITPAQALEGFSNPSVILFFILFSIV